MVIRVKHIIIFLMLVAVVVAFHIVRRNATMRGIETTVSSSGTSSLMTADDVDSIIVASYPDIMKTDIKDVDKKGIRKILAKHPYVQEVEVGMSTGGKLTVDVLLRQPVVRMFYQDNEFYLSRQGTFMPLSRNNYCNILVGSCETKQPRLLRPTALNLTDTSIRRQPSAIMKIWTLAAYLYDNPEYGEIFDQVCIDSNGDLVLVPKLGNTTVIVGDTTLLQEKFENLWAYFDQGARQVVGWDTYKTISLKYRNQVVCARK